MLIPLTCMLQRRKHVLLPPPVLALAHKVDAQQPVCRAGIGGSFDDEHATCGARLDAGTKQGPPVGSMSAPPNSRFRDLAISWDTLMLLQRLEHGQAAAMAWRKG